MKEAVLQPDVVGARSGWSWRRAAVCFAAILLMMAIVPSIVGGAGWFEAFQLAHDGRTTVATVTELHLSDHDGCKYIYAVNGKAYRKSEEVCGAGRAVGETLVATYLPAHPSTATALPPAKNLFNHTIVPVMVGALLGLAGGSTGFFQPAGLGTLWRRTAPY